MDWMPSPFGDGENDPTEEVEEDPAASEIRQGYTGGDTRFQMLARVTDTRRHVSVTLKADLPHPIIQFCYASSVTVSPSIPVYA